mgnify:CR=1 FL=1
MPIGLKSLKMMIKSEVSIHDIHIAFTLIFSFILRLVTLISGFWGWQVCIKKSLCLFNMAETRSLLKTIEVDVQQEFSHDCVFFFKEKDQVVIGVTFSYNLIGAVIG